MRFSMGSIIGVIIALCLLIGENIAVYFWGYYSAPKEIVQNISNNTTVETTTYTYQNTMQGQVTTILNNTSNLQYLNVNVNGATNISYRYATNSNFISITN